jgi:hypothetical protein
MATADLSVRPRISVLNATTPGNSASGGSHG